MTPTLEALAEEVKAAQVVIGDETVNYGRNHERTIAARVAFHMVVDRLASLAATDRGAADEARPMSDFVRSLEQRCAESERDAARYRVLRHSLSGEAGCSHTRMPKIEDPFYRAGWVTYLPHGLDQALDAIISERAAMSPITLKEPT